jgi:hypothetical protein
VSAHADQDALGPGRPRDGRGGAGARRFAEWKPQDLVPGGVSLLAKRLAQRGALEHAS